MKAIVIREHGGPEKLRLEEIPTPEISENEVLVRVKACALNHLDIWIRRGIPGIEPLISLELTSPASSRRSARL